MIERHSSRRRRLDSGFLNDRLTGARSYDRIAGYFSSSILEVAGEALESVEGKIRVVCNSALARPDIEVAKAAQAAMRRAWCDSRPEALGDAARSRFRRLHDLLRSGKLEVRVLPDDVFGLIHGKAGVITRSDGRRTSFLGSANESASAFRLNYELVWEDDAPEAVVWVQEEFDALWSSPFAVPLAEFVVADLDRLARRELIPDVERWQETPDPASVMVKAPVYRQEVGLWEHQKHFVKLAFDAHRGPHGARFVLADQVGLGKTLQLAMAAQLMALVGDRPVLVLAPKTLVWQWQDELDKLLGLPSAIWTGGQWVDERGVEHPAAGPESIRRCPRRVGIVSTGLIVSGSETATWLSNMRFECVILDEAHRARRRNLDAGRAFAPAQPNMHPIEAYDLLDALARGSDAVLGGPGSRWRNPRAARRAGEHRVVPYAAAAPDGQHDGGRPTNGREGPGIRRGSNSARDGSSASGRSGRRSTSATCATPTRSKIGSASFSPSGWRTSPASSASCRTRSKTCGCRWRSAGSRRRNGR